MPRGANKWPSCASPAPNNEAGRGGRQRTSDRGIGATAPQGTLYSQPADHTARATAAPLPAAPPRGPAGAVRGAERRGRAERTEQKSEGGPLASWLCAAAVCVAVGYWRRFRRALPVLACGGEEGGGGWKEGGRGSARWLFYLRGLEESCQRPLHYSLQWHLSFTGLEAKAGGSWFAAHSITVLRDSAREHCLNFRRELSCSRVSTAYSLTE
ncbi:uncharacterized protein LOC122157531 [Centrocercus urophasianus]|uniref:uncharacterized protein LOC122157531 n=1 Tax=Centrocercus urophasianus TaxID=9002 RepID=UPI001C6541A4|nr:uncharacterized protein LOC122157531 [Centrocercus urophasianus]